MKKKKRRLKLTTTNFKDVFGDKIVWSYFVHLAKRHSVPFKWVRVGDTFQMKREYDIKDAAEMFRYRVDHPPRANNNSLYSQGWEDLAEFAESLRDTDSNDPFPSKEAIDFAERDGWDFIG